MAVDKAAVDKAMSDEPEAVGNGLDLLTRDHRLVDQLFLELDRAAPQQLDPLARRLCKLLRVHTQIEEELFYPVARQALGEDAPIDHAEEEHAQAKRTLVRVESLSSEHADFRSAIATLRDQVRQHVEEEEQQLFPRLRSGNMNLVALGVALIERRATLLDVLGLHADDEEVAIVERTTAQSAAQSDAGEGRVGG